MQVERFTSLGCCTYVLFDAWILELFDLIAVAFDDQNAVGEFTTLCDACLSRSGDVKQLNDGILLFVNFLVVLLMADITNEQHDEYQHNNVEHGLRGVAVGVHAVTPIGERVLFCFSYSFFSHDPAPA